MKYLQILRDKLAKIDEARTAALDAIEALATAALDESRALTADDQTAIDAHRAAVAEIDAPDGERAKLLESIAELEAVEARTAQTAQRPELQVIQRVEVDPDADVRYLRPSEARDQALAVLDDKAVTRHLDTDQVDKLDTLVRTRSKNLRGDEIARRLLATETPAYRSAWQKLVTAPTPVLTAEEGEAVQRFQELRAMSLTDAAGGFGVPVLIDPTIILTAQGSLNPFRAISRVETITTDEWKGVSSAGVSWSYDTEGSAVGDDSPTLAQPNVATHMARGFIPFSIEIGMDYPSFAEEMATLLASGYDELQAQSFATGNGTTAPFGILTALDANTNVEVVVTTDGAFGGVDINKVWGALPDRWKANATWVMNHDVGNEVASFGASNNLSFVTVNLTDQVSTIRQRPVAFASHFPDFTGTTGASNILVVGDFRNYVIAERAGMSVELVPHLVDVTNNRPTGQRGWFAWARHGADSVNDLGFRLLQNQ